MQIEGQGALLRIYLGESDRFEGVPLHEAIVRKAKESGLAGATVLRGLLGYGASSRIHSSHILRLSEDLPLVVEIVDREERIRGFLGTLDGMVSGGVVTMERVEIVRYRPNAPDRPKEIDE